MANSQRRAVVHIGHEKTGSTALQHALARDSNALRAAGVLLPRSPGKLNHTQLVTACLEDGTIDNLKSHQMARRYLDEAGLRKRFLKRFNSELAGADNWHTLLITSELITSRLQERGEIDRLLEILQSHVDTVEVVLFLRRQDRLAVSRFSSALRSGYDNFYGVFDDMSRQNFIQFTPNRVLDDFREFYDYDRILRRYEGRPGVTVRPALYDGPSGRGDPIAYLYDVLGYRDAPSPETAPRLNSGLCVEAQFIIAELNKTNKLLLPSGERNAPYRALLRRIEAEVEGAPRRVCADHARSFLARFAEGNESVRARYFQQADTLFDDDFSSYPDHVDYGHLAQALAEPLANYRALAARTTGGQPLRGTLRRIARKVRDSIGAGHQ